MISIQFKHKKLAQILEEVNKTELSRTIQKNTNITVSRNNLARICSASASDVNINFLTLGAILYYVNVFLGTEYSPNEFISIELDA